MKYTNHKVGIRGIFLVLCALQTALAAAAAAQSFGTTTVQGTVYMAGGSPASGTLQLSWPAFTTAKPGCGGGPQHGQHRRGRICHREPGAQPGCLAGGVVLHGGLPLNDGTTSTEYWVVPGGGAGRLLRRFARR